MYLEEAAGISKYKERRKETETRIRHTRENLDRLNDLREEVGKQLQHLARQARQAEQYQAIQAERKVKDAEWKALEFRALDARLQALREQLAQRGNPAAAADRRAARRRARAGNRPRAPRRPPATRSTPRRPRSTRWAARWRGSSSRSPHQRELSVRLQRARDEAQAAAGRARQPHRRRPGSNWTCCARRWPTPNPGSRLLQRGRPAAAGRPARRRSPPGRLAAALGYAQPRAGRGRARGRRRTHPHRTPGPADPRRRSAPPAVARASAPGWISTRSPTPSNSCSSQHETQKESLESLTGEVETRKQASQRGAGAPARRAVRAGRACASRRRPRAAGCRRWKRCRHAALGQEQGARAGTGWKRARPERRRPRGRAAAGRRRLGKRGRNGARPADRSACSSRRRSSWSMRSASSAKAG